MKFSIIVPVYNVEKYIETTINSVIGQDYWDVELILVNDGSKDRSGEICREYAAKDPRIVFIDKENGGVASARNAGIDVATGDYMMFLDSDDYYKPGTFRRVAEIITETGCDICQFGYTRFSDEWRHEVPIVLSDMKLDATQTRQIAIMSLTSRHISCDLVKQLMGVAGKSVTNAAVRASIIKDNHLQFFGFWNNEDDWIFAILCYKYARSMYWMAECRYEYRYLDQSLNIKKVYIKDLYEKKLRNVQWIQDTLEDLMPGGNTLKTSFTGVLQRQLILLTFYNETAVKTANTYLQSRKLIVQAVKSEESKGIHKDILYNAGKVEKLYMFMLRLGLYDLAYFINRFIIKKYR